MTFHSSCGLVFIFVLSLFSHSVAMLSIPQQGGESKVISSQTADTYFLDSILGADSGNCSYPSYPCLSLSYVFALAGTNNTIKLAKGNYTLSQTIMVYNSVIEGEPGTQISCTGAISIGFQLKGNASLFSLTISNCPIALYLTSAHHSTIQNCTITRGSIAIYIYFTNAVTIAHSIVVAMRGNGSAALLAVSSDDLLIADCSFADNDARADAGPQATGWHGGGASLANCRRAVVRGCAFARNVALRGAGLVGDTYSDVVVQDCTFENNIATGGDGGAMFFGATNVRVLVSRVRIWGNSGENGGGVYVQGGSLFMVDSICEGNSATIGGGGICFDTGTTGNISNCNVTNNTAETGGGFYINGSAVSLNGSRVAYNNATNSSGIHVANARLQVTYSIIFGNNAVDAGGGIGLYGSSGGSLNNTHIRMNTARAGGGIFVYSNFLVADCTILNNTATSNIGAGIYIASRLAEVNLHVINTLITNASPNQFCCTEARNWITGSMTGSVCNYPACNPLMCEIDSVGSCVCAAKFMNNITNVCNCSDGWTGPFCNLESRNVETTTDEAITSYASTTNDTTAFSTTISTSDISTSDIATSDIATSDITTSSITTSSITSSSITSSSITSSDITSSDITSTATTMGDITTSAISTSDITSTTITTTAGATTSDTTTTSTDIASATTTTTSDVTTTDTITSTATISTFTTSTTISGPTSTGHVPICGNGILEGTETCERTNASDLCCDYQTCKVYAGGSPCRSSKGPCDSPEMCDGIHSACPSDIGMLPSFICEDESNVNSQCYVPRVCGRSKLECPPGRNVTLDACGVCGGIVANASECQNKSYCGDSVCAVEEDCMNCFLDCGSCAPIECDDNCSGRGECDNGVCKCKSGWSGNSCDTTSTPVVVNTTTSEPTVTIGIPQNGQQVTFSISLTGVKEIEDGELKQSFDLSFINETFTQTDQNSSIWTYVLHLQNNADIVISYLAVNNLINIIFGNDSVYLQPNTLKLTIEVVNWPFVSIKGKLQLSFLLDTPMSSSSDCEGLITSEIDTSGNVRYFNYKLNGVTMYATFLSRALIDQSPKPTTVSLHEKELLLTIPHFWAQAIIDPDFSVLLEEKTGECDSKRDMNGLATPYIVLVVVVAFVAIIVVVVLFLWQAKSVKRNNVLMGVKMRRTSAKEKQKSVTVSPLYKESEYTV